MDDLLRDRMPWIHECYKPVGYLALHYLGSGNLRQFVFLEGNTGGLGVDDNHVRIVLAEIGRAGHLGQRSITLDHVFGRAFLYKAQKSIVHLIYVYLGRSFTIPVANCAICN